MQNVFDTLIDSFIKDKIGIAENFLSRPLAARLKDKIAVLFTQNMLRYATTGNDSLVSQNKSIRGDLIYWLDRTHHDPCENDFLDRIDSFVEYLNATCYTGITAYEFHYAIYQEGSFYKTHLDQFHNNTGRQYTMILYLNTDWQVADGGELCIHQDGLQQNISPDSGKSVFFKSSELLHEVLLTNKIRMSITGWLKV